MKTPKLTKESEEYLETIYRLQKRDGIAKTTEIAKQLNVALGSVTNTIEALERRGLVEHKPYKGVKLTGKGLKEALKVIRKHRLAERLLVDALKMEWSKVHEAACLLEHALTEDVLQHIEKVLENPKKCPHGNPIPTSNGKIKEHSTRPIHMLKVGEYSEIVKITEESEEKLKILDSYGIKPKKGLRIADKNLKRGVITVEVDNEIFQLSLDLASTIWVKGERHEQKKRRVEKSHSLLP